MKKLIAFCICLLFFKNMNAQAPEKISYQAVLRDASGALIKSSEIGMRISILLGSATGTAVFEETQTPMTNDNGLISIEIGSGVALSGSFAAINWANGIYYVKTETDPNGGTNYVMTASSQLLSLPYALYAKTTGSVSNGNNFTHHIGEAFGGGVIFHLWKDAQGVEHGLILDLVDLSVGQVWSNVNSTLIGSGAQSHSDGLSNSLAIVAQAGHTTSAAALCLNSTNGGQSDWYLPSLQELNMVWNSYRLLGKALSQIAVATQLTDQTYWSSTESDANNAAGLKLGFDGYDTKIQNRRVRAVRAF